MYRNRMAIRIKRASKVNLVVANQQVIGTKRQNGLETVLWREYRLLGSREQGQVPKQKD